MEGTQSQVLEHLRLYRVTLRAVLDQAFFAGKKNGSNNVVAALTRKALIEATPVPGSALKAYVLTRKGAHEVENVSYKGGVPKTLEDDLRVLWWCFLGGARAPRRHRLDQALLARFYPKQAPDMLKTTSRAVYCLENHTRAGARLFRVQTVGEKTKPDQPIKQFRAWRERTLSAPESKVLSEAKHYGVAFLFPNTDAAKKFHQHLRRNYRDLHDSHLVDCGFAPLMERIAEEL